MSSINEYTCIPFETNLASEDFSGLILCLCGLSGAYITGAIIPLDGGMNSARTLGLEQGIGN